MSKRFIDTEIFNDSWFMDLSVNAKLLYIYMITNCDHAGIIDINWKLAELQTGIKQLVKSYESLLKELGNRLIHLRNGYYFITRFILFQYPKFPNSKVMQQRGAINRLLEFNLFDEKNQTLNKELINSYEDDNGSDIDNGSDVDNGKVNADKIIYPWNEDEFLQVWEFWKRFKKEQFAFTYKPIGEQGALGKLSELSDGKVETAMLIIKQSIQNGWKGLFELKGDKSQEYNRQEIYDLLNQK